VRECLPTLYFYPKPIHSAVLTRFNDSKNAQSDVQKELKCSSVEKIVTKKPTVPLKSDVCCKKKTFFLFLGANIRVSETSCADVQVSSC